MSPVGIETPQIRNAREFSSAGMAKKRAIRLSENFLEKLALKVMNLRGGCVISPCEWTR